MEINSLNANKNTDAGEAQNGGTDYTPGGAGNENIISSVKSGASGADTDNIINGAKSGADGGGAANTGDRIIILDTTLRDGEQTPGVNLSVDEKLEIAKLLEQLGVDVIEAGFPISSQSNFDATQAIAKTARCGVAAFCRCVPGDIERAWEAVRGAARPRLHVCIATSDIHMQYKLKMSPDEVFRRAVSSVRLAKSLCPDVEFSCEDASRSDPEYLCKILEAAIAEGATTVNVTDTVGYAMPGEFGGLIQLVFQKVPNIRDAVVSVHCHNDLGLAVANSIVAVRCGARQVETTINGLGERAGNCPAEELIMSLTARSAYFQLSHGIDTKKIYRTSQRVSRLTGIQLPVNKAVVGQNAFAHDSGIHQHGVLSNPTTYEIMTPQSVGKTNRTMTLGKLSGRHAFVDRLGQIGITLSKEDVDEAFERFKNLADRKKTITNEDLEAIVNSLGDVPEIYKLTNFQLTSGKNTQSLASVTLMHAGREISEAATGDGPIDAAYNAAVRIVGGEWPLISYDIKAVTEGMDALGEVIVRVGHEGGAQVGRGLSTDIIEASIFAYVNAINRALARAENHQTHPKPSLNNYE